MASQGPLKSRMDWVRLPLREPTGGDRTAASTAVFQTAHASSSLAHRSSFERKELWRDAPLAQPEERVFRTHKIGVRGVNGAPLQGVRRIAMSLMRRPVLQ